MKRLFLLAVAGLVLATAGPASGATWQAWLGEPGAAPAGTPKGATLNQIFPRAIKIHAGDKIRYSTHAFHTASYLGGVAQPRGVGPNPAGGTYTGITDAAGAPFWFNGLPKFMNNPQVFAPVGSPAVRPGSMHSVGVVFPTAGPVASKTLSFPKAGTYKIICLLHEGMNQTVVVKAKKAKADKNTAVKTRIAKESTALWKQAKALAAAAVPANTVFAGVGKTATLLAFLPDRLTVPAGTTVNFVNMSPSEPHNEAFGPKDWIEKFMEQTDLIPFTPDAPSQASPVLIYGSEPPGGYLYTGSNHGNGFLATGLTDDAPGDPPNGLPQTKAVKFTKPGTFHYFCLIHGPDMSGDIVVTG